MQARVRTRGFGPAFAARAIARLRTRLATVERNWVACVAVACLVSGAYLAISPHSVDLAAHNFRTWLFGTHGFQIYNNQWYGGHHMPGYSLLFPPLAALFGQQLVACVACVWQAAVFEPLVRFRFGHRARWAALWFAAGTGGSLFTGRLVFALGVAFGVSACLALQRGHPWIASLLGVFASLASPVAGAFLAVCGAALLLDRRGNHRRGGALVCVASLAAVTVPNLVFFEGGYQPLELLDFASLALFYIGVLVLVHDTDNWVRIGTVLFLAQALAVLLLPNAFGGNALRFAPLAGGPVVAAFVSQAKLGRSRKLVAACVLVSAFVWQFIFPVGQVVHAKTDPTAQSAFYTPLNRFLATHNPGGERTEVVFTQSHWEASEVAPRFALARGWERQLDTERNHIFYDGSLNQSTYGQWLSENAVRYVALPHAPLDYSAEAERSVVESHPPYLVQRFTSPTWTVYEVMADHRMVISDAADPLPASTGQSSLTVDFRSAGSALVRMRYSPYWVAQGGCVSPAGQWTEVTAAHPGPIHLRMAFAVDRVLSTGPRCDHG